MMFEDKRIGCSAALATLVVGAFAVRMMLTPEQGVFALLLLLSFCSMAWVGHVVLSLLGGERTNFSGLFFKTLVGQFAFLLVWILVSPLLYFVRIILEVPAFLSFIAAAALLLSLFFFRSLIRFGKTELPKYQPSDLALVFFGIAALLKIGAYYSASAGALGLDTHQHIAFALNTLDSGYQRLEAGSTGVIDEYPKIFHAITAIWAWPGFGGHIGPYLKIQPALQSLLCVLSLVELTRARFLADLSREIQFLWVAASIAVLSYVIFRGSTFVYPISDLNSTARLSAASTLWMPILIALYASLAGGRAATIATWASLPVSAALSAALNPSLALAWLTVTLPAWFVFVVVPGLRRRSKPELVAGLCGLLLGGAAAALILLSNSYYLNLLGERSENVRSVLEWFGLRLDLSQSSEGLGLDLNLGLPRISEVLQWVAWRDPATDWARQMLPQSSHYLAPWLASFSLSFALITLGLFALTDAFASSQNRMSALKLAGLQVSFFAVSILTWFVATVFLLLVGHATLEASLLSTYVHRYVDLLGLVILPFQWVLSLALSARLMSTWFPSFSPVSGMSRRLFGGLGLAVIGGSALFVFLQDVPGPSKESMGWPNPVSEVQLQEFRRVEALLPAGSRVLAPALPALLNGREEWILPVGRESTFLPFARGSYIFNVRLGEGYTMTALDLRRAFCDGDVETARSFIRRESIDFIFVVRGKAESTDAVLDRKYCNLRYADIGVVAEGAVFGKNGISFYPLSLQQGGPDVQTQ